MLPKTVVSVLLKILLSHSNLVKFKSLKLRAALDWKH